MHDNIHYVHIYAYINLLCLIKDIWELFIIIFIAKLRNYVVAHKLP